MKKITKYIVGSLLLPFALGSCTGNFEEYNTNPNEPTELDPASLIAPLLDCLASPEENPCQRNNTFWAGPFGGYITPTNNWSREFHFYTYNISDDWNKWSPDWYFTTLYKNYFSISRQSKESGPIFALAKMLRVNIMQFIVNMQGPLPYSQVKEGTFSVPYDDEQTAYKAMFDDLDAAIASMTAAATASSDEVNVLADYDRVYDGDYTKWVKYANTLKLRMAIRISGVSGMESYAHQKALEAVTHSIGVMSSASDTAWDKLNSRYKNGFHQVQNSWGEMRANATIVAYMSGYEDPRLPVYFLKVSGGDNYVGVRSGIKGITPSDYADASKFNVNETTPMLIFSAAEAEFLRAEAALKGWSDVGASAKDCYEKGIAISFAERGISASAADYYNNDVLLPGNFKDLKNSAYDYTPSNKVTIKWDDTASAATKLNRVITQKWIANFPLGIEGWNDYRRTGYPDIFPAYNNLSTQGVTTARGQRRLRFSLTEYETNKANVEAAASMIGGDKENIDLWWALKN